MLWGTLDPRCVEFESVREQLAGPLGAVGESSCAPQHPTSGRIWSLASGDRSHMLPSRGGAGRLHLERVTKSCFPADHPLLTTFTAHPAHLSPGGVQQQLFFGGEPEELRRW